VAINLLLTFLTLFLLLFFILLKCAKLVFLAFFETFYKIILKKLFLRFINVCGITGYIGKLPAAIEAIDALSILEYRGYDSAGVAASNLNDIKIKKVKGYVDELKNHVFRDEDFLNPAYFIAIAHTRWATHGKPSIRNAHPHISCNGEIAVVHNGIIENYDVLKNMLIEKGHRFSSDTDTEVLAHLIEDELKNKTLVEAVKKAIEMIEGTYGLAIIAKGFPYIVGVKHSSPLKLGIANHGFYISSDVNALIGKAREYISLKDGQIVVISKDKYKVYGTFEKKTISYIREEVTKGDFPTFMLKEIYEQEKAIKMALSGKNNFGRLKLLEKQIERNKPEYGLGDIGKIEPSYMKKVKRIALIGSGSSYHAALCGSYLFNNLDMSAKAFLSSEAKAELKKDFDLYIFISQSGETADTIEVLRMVNEWDKPTFGICNVPGSTIAEETKGGKFTYAGPELSVASTKAFTTQLAVLFLLYVYFKALQGDDVKKEIRELREIDKKVGLCIKNNDAIAKNIAYEIKDQPFIIYIGRHLNYAIALEGSLKMKEISYIPSIAYAGGELKHGPLALINRDVPVIAINTQGLFYEEMKSNIKEVEAREGKIYLVSDNENENPVFLIPKTLPMFSPLLSVIPLQLLAYHASVLKGNNVDKPRNLAKSVTVK
jgi:glucosamine--fructose-6-phosphate aminotransferase (isomerizing)